MSQKSFEEILQQKMQTHQELPPQGGWEAIAKRMQQQAAPISQPATHRVRSFNRYWLAAAASVALLIGIGSMLYYTQETTTAPTLSIAQRTEKTNVLPQTKSKTDVLPETSLPLANASTTTQDTHKATVRRTQNIVSAQTRPTTLQPTTDLNSTTELNSIKEDQNLDNNSGVTTPVNTQTAIDHLATTENTIALTPDKETEANTVTPNNTQANPTIDEAVLKAQIAAFEAAGKAIAQANELSEPIIKEQHAQIGVGILSSQMVMNASGNSSANSLLRGNNSNLPGLSLFTEGAPLTYKHSIPISIGVMVQKKIKGRFSLESGLLYNLLLSTYKSDNATISGEQVLHYIGIPLMASFKYANWGKTSLYASAGGRMDYNIAGSQKSSAENYTPIMGDGKTPSALKSKTSLPISDKSLQFSVHLNAGIAYRMIDKLEAFFEPSLGYYFSNSSPIQNCWKEKPLQISIQLGLRTFF